LSVSGFTYLVGAEQLKRVRVDLDRLVNALASVATDKLRVSVVDALPESPFNITKVAGTALTGRDWSLDFARLQNIDVALSTRASEATLASVRDRLPASLTAAGNFRIAVVEDAVGIARDSTLSSRLPRVLYDSAGNELSGYIKNVDTPLSSFAGTPGSSPPSRGIPILGYDGAYLRLVRVTSDGRVVVVLG